MFCIKSVHICLLDFGTHVYLVCRFCIFQAAFLTRLVEPNIVTASARTSLKSVSSGGTGLQLSARHCFIIEDPTDEKKPDDKERLINL